MESWLVERYLASRFRIPARWLQPLLDLCAAAALARDRMRARIGRRAAAGPGAGPLAERADALMASHYDLPAALFESFLGASMKYSMALWQDGAGSLDEAQARMLADLCEKAQIRDGAAVLDLGCGFGSLAAHLLERYPHAEVVGLNLSKTQCEYLRGRQADPRSPLSSPRFTLVEDDFNRVQLERRFDRVVSVGFFEHVADLAGALARIDALLEPEGRCFLHFIVRERAPGGERPVGGFIGRLVFPGCRIHPRAAIAAIDGPLELEREWFLAGSHYERTLQAWLAAFREQRPALERQRVVDARSLDLWELYLMVCIAIFRTGGGLAFGNGQYRLRRRGAGRA